eukprot:COSAG03_NODE_6545_length_1043_cov_1.157839_3_plen_54_part_01
MFFSESGQAASGLVLTPITHAMEMNLHWDNASSTLNVSLSLFVSICLSLSVCLS